MPEINRLVPEAGIIIHLKSMIYGYFGAFLGTALFLNPTFMAIQHVFVRDNINA